MFFASQPARRLALWIVVAGGALLLSWFVNFRPSSRIASLLWNTAWLSATVACFATSCGVLLAWLVGRTNLFGRRSVAASFCVLLFMPLYLQAAGWDAGFGRQGWFSYSRDSVAAPLLSGWWAAVWIHTCAAIPWVLVVVRTALSHVPAELEEQTRVDGATGLVLRRATWPTIRSACVATLLWIAVSTASEMTVTDMYQVRTYAEEVYTVFALGEDAGISTSEQVRLNLFVGASLVALAWWGAKRLAPQPLTSRNLSPPLLPLGRTRPFWTAFAVLVTLVVMGVPLANLIYNAGVRVEQQGLIRVRSWSPAKFVQIVADSPLRYRMELWWSSVIGVAAASLAVAIATPVAWWARGTGWRRLPAIFLVTVGVAIPGPLLGLAIIRLLNRETPAWLAELYDHSILAPTLALAIRSMPPVIFLLWHAFQSFPQALLDTASLDGFGPLSRFLRIVLPQRRTALLTAFVIGFAVSVGDLAASVLVLPPSTPTLAFTVFQLAHAGVDDRLAGLCLCAATVFALLALATSWLQRNVEK